MPNEASDGRIVLSLAGSTTVTLVLYYTFSVSITTKITEGCNIFPEFSKLSIQEKEQFAFLILNNQQIQKESAQKQGEFYDLVLDSFNCVENRKDFNQFLSQEYEEIFKPDEYGLAFAVRLNRKLEKQNFCQANNLRKFITALDQNLTQEFPSYPFIPKETRKEIVTSINEKLKEQNELPALQLLHAL